MNENFMKLLFNVCGDPSFKKGVSDFFVKAQQEGIEKAAEFWSAHPEKDKFSFDAPDMFEQLTAFYANMGFVSKNKYDEVVKEKEGLEKENEFLKNAIRQINLKGFTEEGKKIQDNWKDVFEKQVEANKEMAESFFSIFKTDKKE